MADVNSNRPHVEARIMAGLRGSEKIWKGPEALCHLMAELRESQ